MNKNEIVWFIRFLIFLIFVLSIFGSPSFYELGIVIAVVVLNWVIMRYIIDKISSGDISTESQMKELGWFSGILVVFLSILVIIGSPTHKELIIATTAFTFLWIVRSFIAKTFAPKANSA